MSVVLVNGDGNPAVHASQDADLLGGIGGQETGILDINDKFAATIADANTVEISSGVCITKEGRRIQIDVGDVEEIVVPTGSQGTTKYYIIGFHLYTDGSGNQLAETFIDEVASSSATITEKMFKDGETEVYVSLYRITRNGLNLEGLTLILPEIGSLAGGGIIGNTDISGIADGTVTGAIAQINTDLSGNVLWINSSPSSDFSATTIQLSTLNNYSRVKIEFVDTFSSVEFPVSANRECSCGTAFWSSTYPYVSSRFFVISADVDSISVGDCYHNLVNKTRQVNNGYYKPLRILAFK